METKYWLITYQKTYTGMSGFTIKETTSIEGDWVKYCEMNGLSVVLFLKEITEEEHKRWPW